MSHRSKREMQISTKLFSQLPMTLSLSIRTVHIHNSIYPSTTTQNVLFLDPVDGHCHCLLLASAMYDVLLGATTASGGLGVLHRLCRVFRLGVLVEFLCADPLETLSTTSHAFLSHGTLLDAVDSVDATIFACVECRRTSLLSSFWTCRHEFELSLFKDYLVYFKSLCHFVSGKNQQQQQQQLPTTIFNFNNQHHATPIATNLSGRIDPVSSPICLATRNTTSDNHARMGATNGLSLLFILGNGCATIGT